MIIVLAEVESSLESIEAIRGALVEMEKASRAHFATPHMAKFRKSLAAAPPKSMSVKVHELGDQLELPS
jgi:quinol monooxygenase YgiN